MRIIILEEDTPDDARQDLFYRINATGMKASDSEIRRGSYPGSLTDFIDKCAINKEFIAVCPISEKRAERYERFKLVLRFFAYLKVMLDIDKDDSRISTSDNDMLYKIMKSNFFLMLYNLVKACFSSGISEIYEDIKNEGCSYADLIEDIQKVWIN